MGHLLVGGWRLLKNSRTLSQKSIYGTLLVGGWVGFSAAVAVAQRLLKNSRTLSQKSIYGTLLVGGWGFLLLSLSHSVF